MDPGCTKPIFLRTVIPFASSNVKNFPKEVELPIVNKAAGLKVPFGVLLV